MTTEPSRLTGTATHTYASAAGITVTAREHKSFERALCRRLIALGFSERLELCDAATGRPRLTFPDIGRAALKEAAETSARGPHYIIYKGHDFAGLRAA